MPMANGIDAGEQLHVDCSVSASVAIAGLELGCQHHADGENVGLVGAGDEPTLTPIISYLVLCYFVGKMGRQSLTIKVK